MRLVIETDFADLTGLLEFKPLFNPQAGAVIDKALAEYESMGWKFEQGGNDAEYAITIMSPLEDSNDGFPMRILREVTVALVVAGFVSPVVTVREKAGRVSRR